jgi:hypothetical protein
MAVEDAYELAYREAVRALDNQRAAASELRSRAGMLLATASIAVSLLGPAALRGGRPLTWAAVVCFVLLVACVLTILWPETWGFEIDPRALLAAHLSEDPVASRAARVELVAHLTLTQRANARHQARLARTLRIGACLLAIQMVLTILTAGTIL